VGIKIATAGNLRFEFSDDNFNDFSAKIKECKTLGAQNVMVPCMTPQVLGNLDELRKFIKNMNKAGKALISEGIHLSYHNHAIDFSRINGKPLFEYLVEETDPRYVFFEPDTHWFQAGGAHVISWYKKLRGRLYIVHFKDYAIDPYSDHSYLECTHKLFAEIGEGNLNWPGIIAECKAQSGIEWCAVEQDQSQRPPYESIAISLKNLKAFGV
jgi:sugar phosphate isomerase/epimerase